MTNFEYYWNHVIPTAIQHIRSTFKIWVDLMTNNFEIYSLVKGQDPYTECYNWFWSELNDDGILDKGFLEYLEKQLDEIENGNILPMTFDIDEDNELNEIFNNIENNESETRIGLTS